MDISVDSLDFTGIKRLFWLHNVKVQLLVEKEERLMHVCQTKPESLVLDLMIKNIKK